MGVRNDDQNCHVDGWPNRWICRCCPMTTSAACHIGCLSHHSGKRVIGKRGGCLALGVSSLRASETKISPTEGSFNEQQRHTYAVAVVRLRERRPLCKQRPLCQLTTQKCCRTNTMNGDGKAPFVGATVLCLLLFLSSLFLFCCCFFYGRLFDRSCFFRRLFGCGFLCGCFLVYFRSSLLFRSFLFGRLLSAKNVVPVFPVLRSCTCAYDWTTHI